MSGCPVLHFSNPSHDSSVFHSFLQSFGNASHDCNCFPICLWPCKKEGASKAGIPSHSPIVERLQCMPSSFPPSHCHTQPGHLEMRKLSRTHRKTQWRCRVYRSPLTPFGGFKRGRILYGSVRNACQTRSSCDSRTATFHVSKSLPTSSGPT